MKSALLLLVCVYSGVSGFRSAFNQALYDSVIDEARCTSQLQILRNNSLFLTFIDASAKIPSGILGGNINDLGDYYQCLRIHETIDGELFEGKYAAITIPLDQNPIVIPDIPGLPDITWPPGITDLPEITWPPGITDLPDITLPPGVGGGDGNGGENEGEDNGSETVKVWKQYQGIRRNVMQLTGFGDPVEAKIFPTTLNLQVGGFAGICVPKVCSASQAINFYQDQIPFINFTFNEFYYRLPNDKPFSPADYTAISIFSFIALLTLLSTGYDLYQTFIVKRPSASPLFNVFSVYNNTRRFLTFNTIPGAIECIDGIRSISMMWVVVGHTFAFTLLGQIQNINEALMFLTDIRSVWVNSAPITVDTFFMLSGLLAVYTTVGKISRGRFIRTIHLFYINRLLRMFPIFAAVILLQASVFNHVSDGPFWVNVAQQAENCRTYWWAALLHVQNYVNAEKICLPQAWYLSVDVQLYFFCPIIMVWLFGRRRFAWIVLTFILLISLASSTTYSFIYNFSAALANPARFSEFNAYVTTYYINTLCRAPPFFVGMFYGYLLYLCKDKTVHISKWYAALLWLVALLLMGFCIGSHYPVHQLDHDAQTFDNFLNAYMRAIWACGLGWIIFANVHGYGGPVNWFLSLQMWKLPARLSFAMYAIHVSVIMIANGSWVKTHYFTEGDNIYRFMSDFTLTFLASFALCITIDAPFSTLQKILLGGKRTPRPTKTESREHIVDDEPPIIKTTL